MEEARKMITRFDLFKLAMSLSRVTQKRFIAFGKGDDKTICFYASDYPIPWSVTTTPCSREERWLQFIPTGYIKVLKMPDLNWKECQFDCQEADNEED